MEKDFLKEKVKTTFKARFRDLYRISNCVTIKDFADYLGMNRQSVDRYYNGERLPDLPSIHQICKKMNVSADWLIDISNVYQPSADLKSVNKLTGLSAEAIEKLISLNGSGMDETLSDIFADKNIDSLLKHIRIATDKAEMIWEDVFLMPSATKTIEDVDTEIADFIVSKTFLQIIANVRNTVVQRKGNLSDRAVQVVKAKNIKELIAQAIDKDNTEQDVKERLQYLHFLSDEERQMIIDAWKRYTSGDKAFMQFSYEEWAREFGIDESKQKEE